MLVFWKEYTPLLKGLFYSITLFVAGHSLMKYIDVETCKSLGEIRTMLNDPEKKTIHKNLLSEDDVKQIDEALSAAFKNKEEGISNIEFLDYLGTLELGAIMLQRGIISKEEFFDQYGYRFENLCSSPSIMNYIRNNAKYYKPILYAISVIISTRTKIK